MDDQSDRMKRMKLNIFSCVSNCIVIALGIIICVLVKKADHFTDINFSSIEQIKSDWD